MRALITEVVRALLFSQYKWCIMGAGILMSIIKRLVLLTKRLIFGCSGLLAPAWVSGGWLCKAERIPFFGIHECCIFAVCYSGGRSSVGISCRTWNWKRVPFHIDVSHSLGQMGQLPSLCF